MIGDPSAPGPGHVLITGPSKTGTTGVYTAVKRGLAATGVDAVTIFEPTSSRTLSSVFLLAPGRTLLTKTTIDKVARVVPDTLMFDRRIMMVRDPRDILISTLLFRPLTRRSVLRADSAAVAIFIAALERKESDPSAMSVRELFELAGRLDIGEPPFDALARDLRRQRRLMREVPFHTVRYEDFVTDDLDALCDYLGVAVEMRAGSGSTTFGHIARSTSTGDYAHWFRDDDVAFFDPILGPYIAELGYDRSAKLAGQPVIDPTVSSEYVRSRYAQRRAALEALDAQRASTWSPDDASDDDIARLVSAADDGDPGACWRIAQVLAERGIDERGGRTALQWTRLAAQLGLPAAMRATADLLQANDIAEPAVRREIDTWRTARRAFAAERQLVRLRESTSHRVGVQLAELAHSPLRNAGAVAREMRKIWRQRSAAKAEVSADAGSS